jgi:hypothetical protein
MAATGTPASRKRPAAAGKAPPPLASDMRARKAAGVQLGQLIPPA